MVKVANLLTGPSLYTMQEVAGSSRLVSLEKVYGTKLFMGEESLPTFKCPVCVER